MPKPARLCNAVLSTLATTEAPNYPRQADKLICHLGVGNFHRAHQASYLHQLLQSGEAEGWGICGIGLLAGDRPLLRALSEQDGLYSLWALDGNQSILSIVGSIMEIVDATDNPAPALAALCDPRTAITSLTITEKGYCLNAQGELDLTHPSMAADLQHPRQARSAIGLIVQALAIRRAANLPPFTVMSCDNLLENGHKARRAITRFAELVDEELAIWIAGNVSFPLSMVDRITPAPTPALHRQLLQDSPFSDHCLVYCEPWRQWILEDSFCQGRPPFERAGAVFTPNVPAFEAMKIGLLNGAHSALSHIALLQGFHRVHEAANNPALSLWLEDYWRAVVDVLEPLPGEDYNTYCGNLLNRFRNPAIADSLLRLAEDSRTKFEQTLLPILNVRLAKNLPINALGRVLGMWLLFLNTLKTHPELNAGYREPDKERLILEAGQALQSGDSQPFWQNAFGTFPSGASAVIDKHLNELQSSLPPL